MKEKEEKEMRKKADKKNMSSLRRLNYLAAEVNMMCLRDYSGWDGIRCPCNEYDCRKEMLQK